MKVRRWLRAPEPFRLIGDCAALVILQEGDDAEASLERELRTSDSVLRSLMARILLFEVRRQRRKTSITAEYPAMMGPLAVNDQKPVINEHGKSLPLREPSQEGDAANARPVRKRVFIRRG